jgi:hypothetical protein
MPEQKNTAGVFKKQQRRLVILSKSRELQDFYTPALPEQRGLTAKTAHSATAMKLTTLVCSCIRRTILLTSSFGRLEPVNLIR